MIQLKDICDIYDCPHTTAKDEGKGYPLVRTPNVGKGRLLLNGIHRVSEEVYNSRNSRAIPEEGDIILAREAPVGNAALIIPGQRVCLGQRVVLIKPKRELADPHFLTYYLLSTEVQHRLKNQANGAVVAHLNVSDIRNLSVTLPNIDEQIAIGKILKSIDDKIELNRQINDNLEKELQAIYLEYFDDTSTTNLGDVVKTTSGGTPSRSHPEYYGGEHKWVKSKELCGSFLINTEETITTTAISKSAAKLLPEKSILIAMYGATVGEYAIIAERMTCNQAICALIPNEDYPYTYLYMVAKNKKEELINSAIGSAQQNISQVLIRNIEISSNINKIKEFHQVAVPYFEIIENNQKENTTLNSIRDIVLAKLMSGELKINDLDC